ncbi:helix-turn-helix domain-containing protein, partial [Acinetobacter baumannii]
MIETIPAVMRFLRTKVKDHAGSSTSLPQIRTLGFLSMNPGASLSKVAEHLGVSNATASAVVDRLVQKGLVERKE